jgi:RNA polymerase sigma factor (sigma-70 family)
MDKDDKSASSALDSELLAQMAETHADRSCAAEAWEEFYRRHYDYLVNVCRSAYLSQIGEGRVLEVVQDSFVKAFRRACTFRPTVGQSAEENRWHVRGWLGTILQNTVCDLYRQEPQVVFAEDIELFPDDEQKKGDDAEESPIGPLENAFMELEEREREVIRETMFWNNPGARQQRMPSDALQALATRLNTTTTNIRQIRSRAIAKLKHAMGEKS